MKPKRYIQKVGVLVEPYLLSTIAQALTREEILGFYEELRRKACGRVMEWETEFEKAFASFHIVLPVPASELDGVGDCLYSATKERDIDRVRFLVRCMRDAGLKPAQATFDEIDCGLSAEQVAALSPEDWEQLVEQIETFPVRKLSVVVFAESLGMREIADIIRTGE